MTLDDSLPRRFGSYLLTAALGQDALGPIFRGLRVAGEPGFVRLRIFESPEISEDAVLDAIEENGEIHSFLKNPAIARGVQMDAVDGVPFLAWDEPNGRTLDALIVKSRERRQGIPIEHALLIGEKVATALDHAYNTTVDGERTLHGLVWPGFVSLSDDGETRLTGFGLAAGFFPSLDRPRFAREVAAYLAPEERANLAIGKNSDVFSAGVLLFGLLFGRLPSATDPLGDVKAACPPGSAILPEVVAVLRTCLSPADSRYQSSGDLRRELGKILFSGPYSPSTFNLAFFISSIFGAEIEADNRSRAQESTLDLGTIRRGSSGGIAPATAPDAPPSRRSSTLGSSRRRSFAIGGALLLAAALLGTTYLITRRPSTDTTRRARPAPMASTPVAAPTPEPTSPPTSGMSEPQFKEEVARRLAAEVKKLEREMQRNKAAAAALTGSSSRSNPAKPAAPGKALAAEAGTKGTAAEVGPAAASPGVETSAARAAPTAAPAPAPAKDAAAESSAPLPADTETSPKILRIVKPIYPPVALQARIGGIVLLRVLVSESGSPEEIEVARGVGAGLTEAAVAAVRKWTFEPARKNGQPVRAWTTIPIPFEP